jgi:hypothetical protein
MSLNIILLWFNDTRPSQAAQLSRSRLVNIKLEIKGQIPSGKLHGPYKHKKMLLTRAHQPRGLQTYSRVFRSK